MDASYGMLPQVAAYHWASFLTRFYTLNRLTKILMRAMSNVHAGRRFPIPDLCPHAILDTGTQRQAFATGCLWGSNCVVNAKIKYSYLVLPMQNKKTIEIDLESISFCV